MQLIVQGDVAPRRHQLLFLHGTAGTSLAFLHCMKQLSNDYEIFAGLARIRPQHGTRGAWDS